MNANEALIAVETRLARQGAPVVRAEAFQAYAEATLPDLTPVQRALIDQGFEAGYAAATRAASAAVAAVQTTALHAHHGAPET